MFVFFNYGNMYVKIYDLVILWVKLVFIIGFEVCVCEVGSGFGGIFVINWFVF